VSSPAGTDQETARLPFDPISLLKRLARHWWQFVIIAVAAAGIGAAAGFIVGTPTFEAEMVMLYNPTNDELSDEFEVIQNLDDSTTFIYRQGSRQERVDTPSLEIQTLLNTVEIPTNLETVREELQLAVPLTEIGAAVSARVIRDTDVMIIRGTWGDAKTAADLANTLARVYITNNRLINRQDLAETKTRLEIRYAETREELEGLEARYAEFAALNNFVDIDQETEQYIARQAEQQTALDQARSDEQMLAIQERNLGESIAELERAIALEEETRAGRISANEANRRIEQLIEQIDRSRQERATMAQLLIKEQELEIALERFDQRLISPDQLLRVQGEYDQLAAELEEDEQIRQWQEEIEALRALAFNDDAAMSPNVALLQELILRRLEIKLDQIAVGAAIETLETSVHRVEGRLDGLPDVTQEYARLRTRIGGLEAELNGYGALLAGAITAYENAASDFSIVSEAPVPLYPTQSSRRLIAAGVFVLVLLLGTMVIVLFELADTRIVSVAEAELRLSMEVLAEIPHCQNPEDLLPDLSESTVFERFRTLALIVRKAVPERGARVLIASAKPSEGKSVVAANLAAVWGRQDERVLFIDAQVREQDATSLVDGLLIDRSKKATHENDVATPAIPGLNEYLSFQNEELAEITQPARFPGVDVVIRGSTQVVPDVLATNRMRELLDLASEQYTIVVIEASATLNFADAALLSRWCNACLFVVRSRTTRSSALVRALDLLRIEEMLMVGTILDDVQPIFLRA